MGVFAQVFEFCFFRSQLLWLFGTDPIVVQAQKPEILPTALEDPAAPGVREAYAFQKK